MSLNPLHAIYVLSFEPSFCATVLSHLLIILRCQLNRTTPRLRSEARAKSPTCLDLDRLATILARVVVQSAAEPGREVHGHALGVETRLAAVGGIESGSLVVVVPGAVEGVGVAGGADVGDQVGWGAFGGLRGCGAGYGGGVGGRGAVEADGFGRCGFVLSVVVCGHGDGGCGVVGVFCVGPWLVRSFSDSWVFGLRDGLCDRACGVHIDIVEGGVAVCRK